jgi:hypothetical protein
VSVYSGVDTLNPIYGVNSEEMTGNPTATPTVPPLPPEWYDNEPSCPNGTCAWTRLPIEKDNTHAAMNWTPGGAVVVYFTGRPINGADHFSIPPNFTSLWVNNPDSFIEPGIHLMRTAFRLYASGTDTGVVFVRPLDNHMPAGVAPLGAASGIGVSLRPAP